MNHDIYFPFPHSRCNPFLFWLQTPPPNILLLLFLFRKESFLSAVNIWLIAWQKGEKREEKREAEEEGWTSWNQAGRIGKERIKVLNKMNFRWIYRSWKKYFFRVRYWPIGERPCCKKDKTIGFLQLYRLSFNEFVLIRLSAQNLFWFQGRKRFLRVPFPFPFSQQDLFCRSINEFLQLRAKKKGFLLPPLLNTMRNCSSKCLSSPISTEYRAGKKGSVFHTCSGKKINVLRHPVWWVVHYLFLSCRGGGFGLASLYRKSGFRAQVRGWPLTWRLTWKRKNRKWY